MLPYGGDSGETTGRSVPRLVAFGFVLSQTLAMVGFLLPWYEHHDALLARVWSDLTHVTSEAARELGIILLVCLVAMAVALVLGVYALRSAIRTTRVLSISLLLESLAIAGPLIYFQAHLRDVPVWSDATLWFGRMGLGWYMTLLCSVGACVLALYMIGRRCVPAGFRPVSVHGSSQRSKATIGAVAVAAAFVTGIAISVAGYFLTWQSGTIFTMFDSTTVSRTGSEEEPLMFLTPVLSVLALALVLAGWLIRDRASTLMVAAAQCVLVTGLSFTVFWGVVVGDWELTSRSVWGEFSLRSGWYICVLGQALALTCVLLMERTWSYGEA